MRRPSAPRSVYARREDRDERKSQQHHCRQVGEHAEQADDPTGQLSAIDRYDGDDQRERDRGHAEVETSEPGDDQAENETHHDPDDHRAEDRDHR